MEVPEQRVVAVGAELFKVAVAVVVLVHCGFRTMPMPGSVEQDVYARGKLETCLRISSERDFRTEEVATRVGFEHTRRAHEGDVRLIILHLRTVVGRATEDVLVFAVRLEDIVDKRHVRDHRLELRLMAPNAGLVLVDRINRMGEHVVVVRHVELNRPANLFEIADASGLFGRRLCSGKDREENRRKDRDDSDHDQKFN